MAFYESDFRSSEFTAEDVSYQSTRYGKPIIISSESPAHSTSKIPDPNPIYNHSVKKMAESDSQFAHTAQESQISLPTSKENADQQLKEPSDGELEDAEKAEKPPPNPWTDPKSFPEGGAKAWLTVAGASACLFVSFGWVNCVGVFQEYYETHQLKEYTASNIAWIPALQSRSSASYMIPFF